MNLFQMKKYTTDPVSDVVPTEPKAKFGAYGYWHVRFFSFSRRFTLLKIVEADYKVSSQFAFSELV